jgi:hypothetical protein
MGLLDLALALKSLAAAATSAPAARLASALVRSRAGTAPPTRLPSALVCAFVPGLYGEGLCLPERPPAPAFVPLVAAAAARSLHWDDVVARAPPLLCSVALALALLTHARSVDTALVRLRRLQLAGGLARHVCDALAAWDSAWQWTVACPVGSDSVRMRAADALVVVLQRDAPLAAAAVLAELRFDAAVRPSPCC